MHIAFPEKGKFMIVSMQKALWWAAVLFGLIAIVSFGAVLIASVRALPHLAEVAAYAAVLSAAAFSIEILVSLHNEGSSKWEYQIANRREVLLGEKTEFEVDSSPVVDRSHVIDCPFP